jgi:hypothetical protein
MKIIMKKNSGYIIGFATIVCLVVILLATCNHRKKNVLVVERENTMLRNINKTLTDEVVKSQDKILILEKKIESMEILNEKQVKNLAESMQNLEYEIVKTVEETEDTALISLFDEVAANQESLINSLENTIKLKDSIISEKDKIIESYVFATDKMSAEIERLHAEKNEMLINEMTYKDQIKKRNKIIIAGGAIVAAGITTAILINR